MFSKMVFAVFSAVGLAMSMGAAAAHAQDTAAAQCVPSKEDSLGPFYKPDAPVRSIVGNGYKLKGQVKSSADCSPISGAKIEFWLAGPDGQYDDAHRATMHSDQNGFYSLESNYPPSYSSRPPHIHIRITAPGYRTLVTQHYPKPGESKSSSDLVLTPGGPQ